MSKKIGFKVLIAGESCHGGTFKWSLPTQTKDGSYKPGRWHTIKGDIRLCSKGFHLTRKPTEWFEQGCIIYVAEYDGKVVRESNFGSKDKFAVKSVRLLRPASDAELARRNIYRSGNHIFKDLSSLACKQIVLMGNATAIVGSGYNVKLYDKSKVILNGTSTVSAFDRSAVKSNAPNATVDLFDKSRLIADMIGRVTLNNNSRAIIHKHRKTGSVHVYDTARVILRNSSKASLHTHSRALCREKSQIEVWGESCKASLYNTSKAIVRSFYSKLKAEVFDSAKVQKTIR